MAEHILTLNAGSSSIKFAFFSEPGRDDENPASREMARGQIEGLGAAPHLIVKDDTGAVLAEDSYDKAAMRDHDAALDAILDFVETQFRGAAVTAVGHRVVHGGPDFAKPVRVDAQVLGVLERLIPLAPLHQPHNVAGIIAAHRCFPEAAQIACFDTAFHRGHPWVNDTFALPRSFYENGIRRYGFHGLSYEYVAEELARHPEFAADRVIVAHLGNGASLCGMKNGRSVCSTMSFTALDGLPMGTRCGQLDPGVILYLLQEEGMTADAIADLLYMQSGLKGLSGLSHDMRELEESDRAEARQAIDYFVSRIRLEIGALATQIGGLDALVFCGGIGEHSVRVRAAVVQGLEWLGLALDQPANAVSEPVISADGSRVAIRVVRTDEEAMIARHSWRLLASEHAER